MSYLVGIVGLLLLVLVHEAGHFLVARAVGMKPTKFYLGFPPAVLRRVRNGIEYGIGAIPLGGYVKIPGMFRPAERDAERYFGPLVAEDPELAPLVDNIRTTVGRADEAATAEALDALERRLAGVPSTPVLRLAHNGIEELREGSSQHAYWRQATWKRVVVIAAGPFANLLVAVVLLTAVNILGVATSYSMTVGSVLAGSPAAKAGLRQGDSLVRLGTTTVRDPEAASRIIQASKGRGVLVVVARNGQLLTLGTIRPEKIQGAYRLGLRWSVNYRKDSAPRAFTRAWQQTWEVTHQIATGLPKLVHPEQRKQVSSVVGIVHVSGEALRADYRDYLGIVALISISLGVLNLLPFLPLDGGHILVALVERVRRRRLRREVVERFSFVGFALVGLLMYSGLTNDVHRYF
ncbi:MAG: regulator of sigma protease [Gaiellaceae bacterium]|nr:regulator of sigma protease [Gaiellaceae bacterium]